MHIVVLTGYYYPYLMPPAGCIKPYLLELAKEHDVDVICPTSNTHYMGNIVRDGVNINYINSIPNKLLAYIKTNQEEHNCKYLTKFLLTLYRGGRFLKSIFSKRPYETSLINSYVKKLQAINEIHNIDTVISVSFPFYTHVAALIFKQKHPSIKWVSYSTDPLAFSESNPIEKWKYSEAIRIEKEVYSVCDRCVITEELYKNLINDYCIDENKILKLPFLMFEEIQDTSDTSRVRPMVLYAGFVFNTVRNPQKMLSVFSRASSVDLFLYISGDRKCREILNKPLPKHVSKNDLVNHTKYIELLSQSDVLINLSNKAKLQAPHKLLELISTGKPIINFYYFKDSGYDLINKYPLGINISNEMDIDDLVDIVENFVTVNQHNRITYEKVKELYPEHLFINQLPKFKEAILKDLS